MSFFRKEKKISSKDQKDRAVVRIKGGAIPYDKIKNNNKIAFIVCTPDEETLKKSINSIIQIQEKYPEKDITVFVSSSYEKMHTLSHGLL